MMSDTEKPDSGRSRFWWITGITASTSPADQANNRRFSFWCILWALAIVAASAVVTFDGLPRPAAWLIALSPNVFGFLALSAYLRFLRMTDELQRRIQLEGLAIGFGIGVMFALGYLVLEAAGAPELSVTAMIMVMMVGWVFGTMRAVRRYQ